MEQAFKGLYENASNRAHVDAHLTILAAIRDVSKLVVKELTSWVCSVHLYFTSLSELEVGVLRLLKLIFG